MTEMTSKERFKRMFEHKQADRVPIIDFPWPATVERWQKEGMPVGADVAQYFGLDSTVRVEVDNSPRYEIKTIEETEEYKITTTAWGATLKNWRHAASTPEFIDFKIKDKDKWLEARQRMTADDDRIPWEYIKNNYKMWKEKGFWMEAGLWFGFDVTHSWTIGTERMLIAMAEDPEWCSDMFNHFLDVNLQLLEKVLQSGYEFDAVFWPDDMGYKHKQFFSINTYRSILKPVHKRAIEWAHKHGIKAEMHSCGDINPIVPELVEIGLDCLNPLEVKAGMDPEELKKKFGSKLVLHGGINALLWENIEAMETEIKRIVPILKENGGYIFSSDHSVPSSVSAEKFKRVVDLVKKIGSY